MSGIVVSQSKLRHTRIVDGKLDGANFRLSHAERLSLERCSLRDADFYEATLAQVTFDHCDLRGANVTKVSPSELRLDGSDLEGVQGATALRGATVSTEQVMPLALALFADLGIRIDHGDD
jgi:uncharacterized protein YjbI with pentapeptide repeats